MPALAHAAGATVEVNEPCGSIAIIRFNHLYPPFDNLTVRRALLRAMNRADFMAVVGGPDSTLWHDGVGLFPRLADGEQAGVEVLSGPRDYEKAKRDLAAAGLSRREDHAGVNHRKYRDHVTRRCRSAAKGRHVR